MLQVRDIMTPDPITVTPDTEVVQAARILLDKGINGLPVVDEGGRLAGIICQSDLINQQKKLPLPSFFTILDGLIPLKSVRQLESQVRKIAAATVSQAMTPEPVTVTPDTGIQEVAALMVDHGFHTLPVVEGGKLAGVVGKEDVLKTLLTQGAGS
jgi:CBS domain-containing protein